MHSNLANATRAEHEASSAGREEILKTASEDLQLRLD